MTLTEAKKIIREYYYLSDPTEGESLVYEEAIRYLTEIVKDPGTMVELAMFYYGENQYDLALKYYKLAEEYGGGKAETKRTKRKKRNQRSDTFQYVPSLDNGYYLKTTGGKIHHKDCRMMRDAFDPFEIPFELSSEQKEQYLCKICCKEELQSIEIGEVTAFKRVEYPVYMNTCVCCGGPSEGKQQQLLVYVCLINTLVLLQNLC